MTNQEINEAVARKLGWTSFDVGIGGLQADSGTWEGSRIATPPGQHDVLEKIPEYCSEIQAAWEIVGHVGGHSSWSMYWLGGPDEKKFWRVSIMGSAHVDSDTAPMAICLAFLKLKESK